MPDREKVIKVLEHCVKEADCIGCVYFEQMKDRYDGYKCDCNKDALALLKEQETKRIDMKVVKQRWALLKGIGSKMKSQS